MELCSALQAVEYQRLEADGAKRRLILPPQPPRVDTPPQRRGVRVWGGRKTPGWWRGRHAVRPSYRRPLVRQSGRELTPIFPATRARDGEIQECEVAIEIRGDSLFSAQPFQPGTSSQQSPNLQTQSYRRPCRVVAIVCRLRNKDWRI